MSNPRHTGPTGLRHTGDQKPDNDVPDETAHGGVLIVLVLIALIVLALSLIFSDAIADGRTEQGLNTSRIVGVDGDL